MTLKKIPEQTLASTARLAAKFIGVGVGPGDPELITLKAARHIQQADVVSYIANEQGQSQAKNIAQTLLTQAKQQKPEQEYLPVIMPMSENRSRANMAYDQAANAIIAAIQANKTVVFLCEGDPLFFGSFAYLLERIQAVTIPCEIVPGISSVNAAASALQLPLTVLKESFAVMSGRHSDDALVTALRTHDTVVIMKAGRSRENILQALTTSKRMHEAKYLEYIGRENQHIEHDVQQLSATAGPYFSLFVVTRSQRDTS